MLKSQIDFTQDDLTIIGPGPELLALNGGHAYRVFMHLGSGLFSVSGISIRNGYYDGGLADANGACIFSAADVSLKSVSISGCDVRALHTTKTARGGGIYVAGDLTLVESEISGSTARGWFSLGGAAYVRGDLDMRGGEIAGNTSTSLPGFYSRAGGIEAIGNVTISGSTIAGNQSEAAAGLDISGASSHTANITNSTISSNFASTLLGGVFSNVDITIQNSTIVFNHSAGVYGLGAGADGIFLGGAALHLRSSIVAGNGGSFGPNDIDGGNGALVKMSSSNNLVLASTLELPSDTLKTCPQLDVLRDNGANIRTHGPLPSSPAIDHGSNPLNLTEDQRGSSRISGLATDIGSIERQPFELSDRIFADRFDLDCAQ